MIYGTYSVKRQRRGVWRWATINVTHSFYVVKVFFRNFELPQWCRCPPTEQTASLGRRHDAVFDVWRSTWWRKRVRWRQLASACAATKKVVCNIDFLDFFEAADLGSNIQLWICLCHPAESYSISPIILSNSRMCRHPALGYTEHLDSAAMPNGNFQRISYLNCDTHQWNLVELNPNVAATLVRFALRLPSLIWRWKSINLHHILLNCPI